MNYIDLVLYVDNFEFKYSHDQVKILENYLEDKILDENLFNHLFEILQKIDFNKYEILECILKKFQPVYPTKHLTFDIIHRILDLIPHKQVDILLIFEPYIIELKSGNLRKIFEIIDPNYINKIIKIYIHKIHKIKGNDFCAILKKFNKEKIEFISDMAKMEFIEQLTCKLDCYISRIPQILECFGQKINVKKAIYYIIINAPDFDMNYYEFIKTCEVLSDKFRPYFIEGFILARKKHGWDFTDKDLTQNELCQKLKELLDFESHQEFVKVFFNNEAEQIIIKNNLNNSNGDNKIFPTLKTLDKSINEKIANFFNNNLSDTNDVQSIIVNEDKNLRNTTLIYTNGKKIIYQQKFD
ncbi:hypothetical protein [Acanthamoeba polyphaga mimivirus]|uniref:Uncharacterized protein n=1 Tax=Acanthamoeba polyphaga mimivirus TaxID=212035 RepID=A0A2L2DKE3_MIMIV|nr:hypothetical protein [Acanthamoeba polyphaga mimivirus]